MRPDLHVTRSNGAPEVALMGALETERDRGMAVTTKTIVRTSSPTAVLGGLGRAAAVLRAVVNTLAAFTYDLSLTGRLGPDDEQRVGRHTGARC